MNWHHAPRKTLKDVVQFDGDGLHSGIPVTVRIRPGTRGIWFRTPESEIEAKASNVSDTQRCTKLGVVSTIEHLMAAFAALEITDAEIELSAGELPAMDGSSKCFYDVMRNSGTVEAGYLEFVDPFSRIFYQNQDQKIGISKGEGCWRYRYDSSPRWPKVQIFESKDVIGDFPDEIAPARTFGLVEELPMIEKLGLARGLTEDSALILDQDQYRNKARFSDEPARHKLLDCMGDLYLSGIPVRFLNVTAEKTGHHAHVEAAKKLELACQRRLIS